MKFIIEALGSTSGGGKAGLLRLLPALASHAEHRFVALLADLPEFVGLERPNLKLILRKKPASLLAREVYLQRMVPRICEREQADALLCLGNFGPRRPRCPMVVLLHNAHYVSGGLAAEARLTVREVLVAWYGKRYLRSLPDSVRLVVQTELMKRRVKTVAEVSPSRVVVIRDADALPPEAAGAKDYRGSGLQGRSCERSDTYTGVCSPFTFLCLAQYYPHKNLEVLVEAAKQLPAYTRQAVRCLLTIHPDQHPGARRLLRRIAREHQDAVLVNIGPVPGCRLAETYGSADAFVLPTLLESFGRTYLEAMRFGLPIVTSDRDFARDVCGQAALYFDPLNPTSVAENMARVVANRELAARLADEGRRTAQRIPAWEEIAAQFVAVLEEAGREGVRRNRGPVLDWTIPTQSFSRTQECKPWTRASGEVAVKGSARITGTEYQPDEWAGSLKGHQLGALKRRRRLDNWGTL